MSALAGVLCPPRWVCLLSCFQFVSHLALSFTLAGVLCPPRWACLPICLPPGFVFQLGWGAVSASLGLSPVLFPNLSPISSGFVFHLGWGAVSASLGLSPNLSPIWLCLSPWLGCCVRLAGLVSQFVSHLALSFTLAGVLCPPRWACRLQICLPVLSPHLFPIWLCLSPWLGAVSASLGLSPNSPNSLRLGFSMLS